MTNIEAKVAMNVHARCVYQGIEYFAVGMQAYNNPNTGKKTESIILHDLRAPSIVHAPCDMVTVKDWHLTPELLSLYLDRAKETFNIFEHRKEDIL